MGRMNQSSQMTWKGREIEGRCAQDLLKEEQEYCIRALVQTSDVKTIFHRTWNARPGSLNVILRQLRGLEDFQLKNKIKIVF